MRLRISSLHKGSLHVHAEPRAEQSLEPAAEQGRRGSVLTERRPGPETRVSYQKHI